MFIIDSYFKNKKLTRNDFDHLKNIKDQIIHTEGASRKDNINIPEFGSENGFFEIELPPGVKDLVDTKITIKQRPPDSDFELNIQADTISMT